MTEWEDKRWTYIHNFAVANWKPEEDDKVNIFIEEGQKLCNQYGQMYNCRIEIKDFDDMFDDFEYVDDFLQALEEELKYYVEH